jgi:ribosomal protein L40E
VAAEIAPAWQPEPVAAEVTPAWEPEPVAAEAEPEPILAAEEAPEPVAAEVAPEPEPPWPVRRELPAIGETILQMPQRGRPPQPEAEPVAAEAEGEGLAARRAQLDLLGLGEPGTGAVTPEQPTVLPYRSRGASVHPSELARTVASVTQIGSFWEASAREVAEAASKVAIQNCGECGLSLSASARFCRRCGSRQARSA